jgi:uncharacterized protein with PIN domain
MEKIKFIADVMVGKLARWLRVLGLDVAYSNTFRDEEIVRIAEAENRIILTRDTGLVPQGMENQSLFIESDHYKEQIQQVLRAFDLKDFSIFSRCIECNTPLRHIDKEEAFDKVPPYIYLTQERFAACPSCNRVYWHGTHADQMLARIPGIMRAR